jgi:ABC-type transporter Mla maintaining outer membrane lipid asymmetry ATPase subunit MlaF
VPPVLRIVSLQKHYHGLRPLRIRDLRIASGERVAISGLDAGASEVLVNLVTGASLPDEGDVFVLEENTRAIADGDAWLASLDRFGIVSPRAVLLDSATLLQNLAIPFTLQIDPVPSDIAARAARLAADSGIPETALPQPIAALAPDLRARAHLARAVALGPALLVLEHPAAGLDRAASRALAADVARVTAARDLATLVISEDREFNRVAAERRYTLRGATGELKPERLGFLTL